MGAKKLEGREARKGQRLGASERDELAEVRASARHVLPASRTINTRVCIRTCSEADVKCEQRCRHSLP